MIAFVVIIGFFATFIGTLAGSGGLISMPLLLLTGIPVHTVIASAKFSNIISSFSSFIYLLKQKQIRLKDALGAAPFAAGGGLAGALLANHIPEKAMVIVAIILLTGALLLNMVKKAVERTQENKSLQKRVFPYLFGISMYDGLFGPGQATLLMYTYLHHGFTYLQALAMSRFQTFISCFFAFALYAAYGTFDWRIGMAQAAGSLIGAQAAVRIAGKLSFKQVKLLLNAITLLLILHLLYEAASNYFA